MSKITILSEIKRDKPFLEKVPKINSKEFDKVIKSRRSIRVFTNDPIPKEVIEKSLDNSLKAPTSSNLQTWEIYWVKSKDIKKNPYFIIFFVIKHSLRVSVAIAKNCFF